MELESQIQLILSIPILSPGICMTLCLHILSIVHGYELSLVHFPNPFLYWHQRYVTCWRAPSAVSATTHTMFLLLTHVPCLLVESAFLPFHAGLAPCGPWHCLWVSVPGGEPLHSQVGEHSLGRTRREASTGSYCPAPYVYVLLHSSGWIPLDKGRQNPNQRSNKERSCYKSGWHRSVVLPKILSPVSGPALVQPIWLLCKWTQSCGRSL